MSSSRTRNTTTESNRIRNRIAEITRLLAALDKPRDRDPIISNELPKLPKNILRVLQTDLKIPQNGRNHYTSQYDLMMTSSNPNLVIRRGQEFTIDVTFNRPYDKLSDQVSFVFSTTKKAETILSRGVRVPLIPSESLLLSSNVDEWGATIDRIKGDTLTIQLKSSSKTSIGKWYLSMDTEYPSESSTINTYNFSQPIYMLFNPWNKSDQVYMPDEDARVEYTLEDTGLIWQGTHNRFRPVPWAYAQFESLVLDCTLDILEKHTNVKDRECGVKISRVLSALVNANDEDEGVLVGKWSGDYDDGISPTRWNGSQKIIQKYVTTKKSVKYGQCWVFAGVLTTLCRTIGIPCRPVTNFSSAHDTHSSMTIDYVFDDEGDPVDDLNTDSVWNFHVWCEAWMRRDDLGGPEENERLYDGWQAIDATPQETSNGIYRLGPASVVACKRGDIKKAYDVDFLFSEVNADKLYWRYIGPGKPLKFISVAPEGQSCIGVHISTKAIGKFEREDITENYKYPEKSPEERKSVYTALQLSSTSFSRYYLNKGFCPVVFKLEMLDDVIIGSPFHILFTIENQSEEEEYSIEGYFRIDNVIYTGIRTDVVLKKHFEISLPPTTKRLNRISVTYEEYSKKMTEEAAFNVACIAKVKETGFEHFSETDFRVRKPDIKFQMPEGKIFLGESFTVTASLLNPLPVKLTYCKFYVDAPGFGEPFKIRLKKSVKIGGKAEADFELTASVAGRRTITVGFISKELQHVDGFVTCQVESI